MSAHVATVREGIVGPGEPGKRIFEGNYVVECPCGYEMHCATRDVKFAEETARRHERTGH